MEQSIKILEAALNGANKAGVFSLQESATIFQAFYNVKTALEGNKEESEVNTKTSKK